MAVSVLSIVALCSGCGGNVTSDGKYYFSKDNLYRVISIDESKTVTQRDVPLQACFEKLRVSDNAFESAFHTVKGLNMFENNSLLFKDVNVLNKDGVQAVYDSLDIKNYELCDAVEDCLYTDFYSYNKKINWEVKYTYDALSGDNIQYGQICDLTVYTFTYEDFNNKWERVASGTFEVYLSSFSYIGEFDITAQ